MTASSPRSGVLILGAGSAIAEAVARRLAEQGARLALVARDPGRLEVLATDLKVRGAPVVAVRAWDLAQAPDEAALDALSAEAGGIDTVVIAYGLLGDQARAEQDLAEAARIIAVNFASAALWALASRRLLERTSGAAGLIVGLGSVAGDRGRKSNFVYGAAKGGLALLLQGLAHRSALAGGPKAMVVKLGFVDTPMTAAFPKGGPLWASPDQAAQVIVKAMGKPRAVVYGPWFWRFVMLIIRLAPESLFNKADL